MATQPPAAPDGMEALAAEVGDIFGVTERPEAAAPAPAEATPGATPAVPAGEVVAPSSPAEPAAPAAPEAQPAAPITPSGLQPEVAPQPAGTPAPAPAPAGNEQALELASTKAQLATVQAQLEAFRTAPTAPAGTTPGQPAAPGSSPEAETPPQYGFVIPDPIAQALDSEDLGQRMAGTQALINAVAARIHMNLREETGNKLSTLRQELQSAIAAPQQEAARDRMQQEYFTAFPAHKNPIIQPILQAEAHAMSLQFPGAAWDDNYRASLGARVSAKIAELTGIVAPTAPVPAPTPTPTTPAPKPAAFTPTGPRTEGAMPSFGSDTEKDVMEVFSFPT